MKNMKKIMIGNNIFIVAFILVMNWFYQANGFDFTLKCICSASFALLGLLNFCYSMMEKAPNRRFYVSMTIGLILAFLGDVLIGYDFIVGAATFALGHICFVIAYCFLKKLAKLDLIASGVLFACAAAFLLFFPLLNFEVPVLKVVCIMYALIISAMLGKAVGNFIREKTAVNGVIAAGSALFFFSDLMLVFDRFIGRWGWTDNACMGTYYPALCLLALSMLLATLAHKKSPRLSAF